MRDMLVPTRTVRNAIALSKKYLDKEDRAIAISLAGAWEIAYLSVLGGLAYRISELIFR